jgi:hypothetical protein
VAADDSGTGVLGGDFDQYTALSDGAALSATVVGIAD